MDVKWNMHDTNASYQVVQDSQGRI